MPLIPVIILFLAPKTLGNAALLSLLGFLIILIVKTLVFLIASDFKTIRAVLFVIAANLVSVLIGLLITIMFMSPDYLLIGIVIIFLISTFPASRLRQFDRFKKSSTFMITFVLVMITLIAIVLFAHIIGYQAPAHVYLSVKIIFATLAIALSLIISIVYEESVISRLYRVSTKESKNFIKPILWANIIGVLALIIIAVILTLTAKRTAPEIKISELDFILTEIGNLI